MPQPAPEQEFWMVTRMPTSQHSTTAPKQRFSNRAAAVDYARRRARETGDAWCVLGIDELCNPTDGHHQNMLL
ncbi:MAG: hypothetical protein AAFN94_00705 [Pseudomonadota bacterium]